MPLTETPPSEKPWVMDALQSSLLRSVTKTALLKVADNDSNLSLDYYLGPLVEGRVLANLASISARDDTTFCR